MIGQSCHGMPISQAIGANSVPKIRSRLDGKPSDADVCQPVVNAAQHAVRQRNQGQERDQHGGDI